MLTTFLLMYLEGWWFHVDVLQIIDVDIVDFLALKEWMQRMPTVWSFPHVSGHQDKLLNINQIDIWGRLNMVAEEYAKSALWHYLHTEQTLIHMTQLQEAIPPITIVYSGKTVTMASNLWKQLTHYIALRLVANNEVAMVCIQCPARRSHKACAPIPIKMLTFARVHICTFASVF